MPAQSQPPGLRPASAGGPSLGLSVSVLDPLTWIVPAQPFSDPAPLFAERRPDPLTPEDVRASSRVQQRAGVLSLPASSASPLLSTPSRELAPLSVDRERSLPLSFPSPSPHVAPSGRGPALSLQTPFRVGDSDYCVVGVSSWNACQPLSRVRCNRRGGLCGGDTRHEPKGPLPLPLPPHHSANRTRSCPCPRRRIPPRVCALLANLRSRPTERATFRAGQRCGGRTRRHLVGWPPGAPQEAPAVQRPPPLSSRHRRIARHHQHPPRLQSHHRPSPVSSRSQSRRYRLPSRRNPRDRLLRTPSRRPWQQRTLIGADPLLDVQLIAALAALPTAQFFSFFSRHPQPSHAGESTRDVESSSTHIW
eukprot:m.196264 g.196264  ORF g.196264 m.196264 type:complete len:363 (-) comp25055_c0_seq1:20-1108(-)